MSEQEQLEPLVVAYQRPSDDGLTKYDLGVLAVRLFGFYLLVSALQYVVIIPNYFLYNVGGTQSGLVAAVAALAPVLYAVAGVVMLKWTGWIVRRAFPEFAAGATVSVTGQDLQAVAFSVVGVWLVAGAVPDLTSALTNYLYGRSFGRPSQWQEIIPRALGAAVQMAFGVLLFFKAKGLSVLWHRMRYAGVSSPPDGRR